MNRLVGKWGRVTSDHANQTYVFEQLKLEGRPLPSFPDVSEEVDRLLADFVIDRPDHPILRQLLGDSVSDAVQQPQVIDNASEEDEDVY
ncbi:hypothetical protein [Pseudohalioglobus lutimaris]|nr:hypothetical protein [Pseudohalioglobus lutimaris]